MAKKDNKAKKNNQEEIKVKTKDSSLSEFVKRTVPTNKEVEQFEQYIEDGLKNDEIEQSLAKMYQNENGESVDISKLDRKVGMGFWGWFFTLVFILIALLGGLLGYYIYFYPKAENLSQAVDMTISGPAELQAGEDFIYQIDYKNPTKEALQNTEIKVIYPENFIFLDSYPKAGEDKSIWRLPKILSNSHGVIQIKGKIIDEAEKKEVFLANMSWTPSNSTAEFRKERALETVLKDVGVSFDFAAPVQILIGDPAEILIKYQPLNRSYLKNFQLKINALENLKFIGASIKEGEEEQKLEQIKNGVWQINDLSGEPKEIKVQLKLTRKINPKEILQFNFGYADDNNTYYSFLSQDVEVEAIKNDLNLNLILNGKANDQGVDFGSKLNYSLAFSNKGDSVLENIALMAIIDGSDILDWNTLSATHNGSVKNNTISWSYRELAALKSLKNGEDGLVSFSVNMLPLDEVKQKNNNANYQISAYAQFGIGNSSSSTKPLTIEDTRSNAIVAHLNSDLSLKEEVRYFNEDNIAVGLGPLPPKVGEATSYRVFWKAVNNLHELKDLKIKTKLPKYVQWISNLAPSAGKISYNNATHDVIWEIGDLGISNFIGSVEFNISLTPSEEDRGKVLPLVSGTEISAFDKETNSTISIDSSAKTTMLEDDDIGMSDGLVR